MNTQILLNPNSDAHRAFHLWQKHQRKALRVLAPAEVVLVENAEDSKRLAYQGALQGVSRFIAIGGAEVLHGIVNGLMELAPSHREHLQVGELSLYGHGDIGRTLALPLSINRQLEMLSAGHTLPMDVGRVAWVDTYGKPQLRYFLGGAGFVPGRRLRQEWRQSHHQSGDLAKGFWRFTAPRVRLEDEQENLLFEGSSLAVLAMGGRYYGGFGEVAPEATPHDGQLDVVWVETGSGWREKLISLARLMLPWGRAFSGAGYARVEGLRVTSQDGPISIETDGQPAGQLPASFSLEPRTLPMIVPLVGVRLKKPTFNALPQTDNGELAGVPRSGVTKRRVTPTKIPA